jgi:hypothetical protein
MSIEPAKKGREKKKHFSGRDFFSQLPENHLANAWNRMSLLLLREKKAERIKQQLLQSRARKLFFFICMC